MTKHFITSALLLGGVALLVLISVRLLLCGVLRKASAHPRGGGQRGRGPSEQLRACRAAGSADQVTTAGAGLTAAAFSVS